MLLFMVFLAGFVLLGMYALETGSVPGVLGLLGWTLFWLVLALRTRSPGDQSGGAVVQAVTQAQMMSEDPGDSDSSSSDD